MISQIKAILVSLAVVLVLVTAGCSSSHAPDDAQKQKSEPAPSAPAATEERLYDHELLEAQGAESDEEKEQLKKRKSSDDDMERLD